MKVAVKDACVLIDLANGGLLESWFQLGIETFTTDLVLRQVKTEHQWKAVSGFVQAGLLKIKTLTGEEIGRMNHSFAGLRIGFEDQTALYVALEMDAVLITGDRRLRIEARKRAVDVRDLLWVLDELIERDVLAPRLAAVKLQAMLDQGAFLPRDECNKRLQSWA